MKRVSAAAAMAAFGGLAMISSAAAQEEYDARSIEHPIVQTGLEVLLSSPEAMDLVRGKRVGLVTNPTGVDHNLNSTIDVLYRHPDVTLVALYGPEHGIRGDAYAGADVDDANDPATGLPVYSLYGRRDHPVSETLSGVDVMLYDIQDIGSRSYTYIYAMARMMQECGRAHIPFIVLDRPNPCGADVVDGNVLNPEEGTSGVGMYPIAYQYGMTPGETARMFNAEFLEASCELHVVPMRGYRRAMRQWDTGLPFVPTSTHIPHAETSVYYQLTGIVGELNNISIGVGYTIPFETLAAPYIDRDALCAALRDLHLPGLMYRPISYEPRYGAFGPRISDGHVSEEAQMCQGVQIFISDYQAVRPVTAQIYFMEVLQRMYPEQNLFGDDNPRADMMDKVLGTHTVRQRIARGDAADEIIADYQQGVLDFMQRRALYLMYE